MIHIENSLHGMLHRLYIYLLLNNLFFFLLLFIECLYLPVMMASSRITCLQALQQYEQLSHTGLPLVNSNKFDSQSTGSEHFAHMKL